MIQRGELSNDKSLNFDEDGEARYFGSTSGRLGFRRASNHKVVHGLRSVRFNNIFHHTVDVDPTSPELEAHLIDLFFNWEEPFCQTVDETLFFQSRANGGKWYSPLLLNSILCIGSRYSDRIEVRSDPTDRNTAGKRFLEKAEMLLHYELQSPSITTIQALMILTTAYCVRTVLNTPGV